MYGPDLTDSGCRLSTSIRRYLNRCQTKELEAKLLLLKTEIIVHAGVVGREKERTGLTILQFFKGALTLHKLLWFSKVET